MKRQRNVALQCTRASEGLSLHCPIESAGIRDQVSPFYSCSQWGGLGPCIQSWHPTHAMLSWAVLQPFHYDPNQMIGHV